MSEGTIDLYFI